MGRPAPDTCWELSPSVALRPESFGALAYDFATRKLTFLKSPVLVEVVRGLGGAADVEAALLDAGVPEPERDRYLTALGALARDGIIREQVSR